MKLEDLDAEWSVINGIVADNASVDSLSLVVTDFAGSRNAMIFGAIRKIIDAGRKADTQAIAEQLRKDGKDDVAVDVFKLEPMTAANVGYYAKKVLDLSRKRRLVEVLRTVREGIEKRDCEDLIGEIEKGLTDMSVATGHEIRTIGEILKPTVRIIEQRVSLNGGLPGISTGFPTLDRVTGGLQGGHYIVIGARPSTGKTALALTMALNMTVRGKVMTGFISSEMTGEQLTMRALAGIGKVNSMGIATGRLGHDGMSRILDACTTLMEAPLLIDDTPSIQLGTLLSRARKMKRMGIRVLYVDYLTLIRHGDARTPKHERVGEVSKSLKTLARELDIPVVALSQVGREAEDRMPTLADLRQSGEIEEDADIIILLHRDKREQQQGDGQDLTVDVDIAKNRTGPTDSFKLIFQPRYVRFETRLEDRQHAGKGSGAFNWEGECQANESRN
jgi:replicative DNA helicase